MGKGLIECPICGEFFRKECGTVKYCSERCRREGTRRVEKRYYQKNYSSTHEVTKTTDPARMPTVKDVLDYAEQYYRKTGEYISYGKAVEMMERR